MTPHSGSGNISLYTHCLVTIQLQYQGRYITAMHCWIQGTLGVQKQQALTLFQVSLGTIKWCFNNQFYNKRTQIIFENLLGCVIFCIFPLPILCKGFKIVRSRTYETLWFGYKSNIDRRILFNVTYLIIRIGVINLPWLGAFFEKQVLLFGCIHTVVSSSLSFQSLTHLKRNIMYYSSTLHTGLNKIQTK